MDNLADSSSSSSRRVGYGLERSEVVVPFDAWRVICAPAGSGQTRIVIFDSGRQLSSSPRSMTELTRQAFCALGAVLLAPLVFIGKRTQK